MTLLMTTAVSWKFVNFANKPNLQGLLCSMTLDERKREGQEEGRKCQNRSGVLNGNTRVTNTVAHVVYLLLG